jgi:hypothetical protein
MTRHWLDGIDLNELLKDVLDCEYCGDGIPKDQMEEHLSWCKPMIESNKNCKQP